MVAADERSPVRTVEDVADGARVATAFPRLTARYFERIGRAIGLVPVSGAAEIAPHLGIADIVVDLVSTGSTLRVNGLREIATVLDSSARLVTRPGHAGLGDGPLGELLDALASVVRARGQRYVMANVPRAALDEIRAVLPGLEGPTVTDILNGGDHVAVHAVVPAERLSPTIRGLQSIGATGILVTRIERLVP